MDLEALARARVMTADGLLVRREPVVLYYLGQAHYPIREVSHPEKQTQTFLSPRPPGGGLAATTRIKAGEGTSWSGGRV